MLAAGNVNTEEEAAAIINIALNNLHAYFDEIGAFNNTSTVTETIKSQNWYCPSKCLRLCFRHRCSLLFGAPYHTLQLASRL
jgi:hypothetical protein